MEKNWTEGSVLKSIVLFAFPYFLSTLLQTLYGLADLFIIGQFNSTDSITAVSIGSQVMHLITMGITGLAMGATITIGKAIGAKDKKNTSLAIGNSVTTFMTGSIILMGILLLLTQQIIGLISTPAPAAAGTEMYLKICFLGIPFITAYNLISAVFRGLGDSKTPMYFIGIAFVCNIALDYLFIGGLSLGPAGAALGTTLAQAVSVICALVVVRKKKGEIQLNKADFGLKRQITGTIFKIGVPVFFQNTFIQVAFMAVTVFVNRRGLYDAAAVGIVEKMIGIVFLIPSSMMSTVSALAAQNIGAKRQDRARQILRYSVYICAGIGILASVLTIMNGPMLIRLFEDNRLVVERGTEYLNSYVWDCVFAGVHFCFSGYFCAIERSELSFAHNFASILLIRLPFSYLAARPIVTSLFPLGLVTTSASLFQMLFCFVMYKRIRKGERSS